MDNQQTVWVVEQGLYSDRAVIAVCSTAAYAEAIKAEWPHEDERAAIEVSEWVVDQTYGYLHNPEVQPFMVVMLRDGEVEHIEKKRPPLYYKPVNGNLCMVSITRKSNSWGRPARLPTRYCLGAG